MKKVLLIVHQITLDPGRVGRMLRERGYTLDIRCPSNQEELPATMEDHDAVAIFGGPMSANDDKTLPFIRTELDWIPTALDSRKPFLGICLGAQLLARALTAASARQGTALQVSALVLSCWHAHLVPRLHLTLKAGLKLVTFLSCQQDLVESNSTDH